MGGVWSGSGGVLGVGEGGGTSWWRPGVPVKIKISILKKNGANFPTKNFLRRIWGTKFSPPECPLPLSLAQARMCLVRLLHYEVGWETLVDIAAGRFCHSFGSFCERICHTFFD